MTFSNFFEKFGRILVRKYKNIQKIIPASTPYISERVRDGCKIVAASPRTSSTTRASSDMCRWGYYNWLPAYLCLGWAYNWLLVLGLGFSLVAFAWTGCILAACAWAGSARMCLHWKQN